MPLYVTGAFAVALAILFMFLMVALSNSRLKHRVFYGDGGVPEVAYRMRAYANFVETTPIALLLLAIVETLSVPGNYLYAFGVLLLCGRTLHAGYFLLGAHHWTLRFLGTSLTMLMILMSAAAIIFQLVSACGASLGCASE